MPIYIYSAFSKKGTKISGRKEAPNQSYVKDFLIKDGYYPIEIILFEDKKLEKTTGILSFFESGLTLQEKIFFTKQLSLLLKSGIALSDTLDLMVQQTTGKLQPMLRKMKEELSQGATFGDALTLYPKSFPPLYVQLVKAGEASGQMEKVLNRLAGFLEEQEEFKKSVQGAVRGPMIQLGMVFVIAGFLLVLIVPKIADVFSSMGGKQLPALTRFVMKLSDLLIKSYFKVGIFCVLIFAIFQSFMQTKYGQYTMDVIKLKIPLIKYFTKMQTVVEFSQTLGLLLESGVNISEALDIVVQITENQILVEALKKAKDEIIKQGRVAEYLDKTGLFSPVSIHLIATGEQSGSLDVMLNQVGKYHQDELAEFSKGLTALLNPLSMVILALVVGTIIFAVMAPLLNMSSLMSQS